MQIMGRLAKEGKVYADARELRWSDVARSEDGGNVDDPGVWDAPFVLILCIIPAIDDTSPGH
jgi:hypothetical protein